MNKNNIITVEIDTEDGQKMKMDINVDRVSAISETEIVEKRSTGKIIMEGKDIIIFDGHLALRNAWKKRNSDISITTNN